MHSEDTHKPPQTSHHQPDQQHERKHDSGMTDTSRNNPTQTGEAKNNPQDTSKKNPTPGSGSPQQQGEEKRDKQEIAS